MPRLVGKKPNYSLFVLPIVLIAAVSAVAVSLEYDGKIDVIPEFGRDQIRL